MKTLIGISVSLWLGLALGITSMAVPTSSAQAQEARITIQGTGQPLPRFMTLKSDKVHMRTGPGMKYPITYLYQREGMPLKVVREFDVWREVVDLDGANGWMHSSTL